MTTPLSTPSPGRHVTDVGHHGPCWRRRHVGDVRRTRGDERGVPSERLRAPPGGPAQPLSVRHLCHPQPLPTAGTPRTVLPHPALADTSANHYLYLTFTALSKQRTFQGALDGGSPMSHVDFKKWQCRMSLSLILLNVICRI